MAYEGSVELISGIKTKNNGTFPLVDAPDVRIDDSTRLSDFVQSIGGQTGAPNGFATLDQNGKVPSIQLPSYVDDVLEYDNQASFPSTGETGKIYVAKDTNKTYRWSGSGYVVISETLSLGETSSTAYRGDRGKTAYDHASAKGSAFASGLYKITTNNQGHVTAATAAGNTDIAPLVIDDNATGVPATTKTWSAQKSINELAKKVNDADLFAGIDIYDPNSASQGQFTFNADAYAHQAGTKYIVHNTGDGVYVIPPASLESACLSYERYTLTEYVQHLEAPKASPVFTGSISLGRKSDTTPGSESIAVGYDVEASGTASTALGWSTKATTDATHAEGYGTEAVAPAAHAEGYTTKAAGEASHSEGYGCFAEGAYSHAEGNGTLANHRSQHVFGENNQMDSSLEPATARGAYVEIVGNGTGSNKSNARALDWNGNECLQGDLYINCNADSTGGTKVGDALDLKANYTDVFSGFTEYVPVHRASFHANTWYHEQGTAYICRLKSDDPDLALVLVGPTHSVPGGETTELPYHLPTATNNTFYVYSLVEYIDSKASKENPVFTGALTIGSTTITESQLQQLLALLS